MTREDYLFCEGDLDATLRVHHESIDARVDAIPRDQFMNARPEEVVDNIVSTMTIEPLEIYEDQAEMEQRETQVDVSAYRDRSPFRDSGPIYVSGVSVTVSIPFSGDPSLWKLKPNHWQIIFPRARVVQGHGQNLGQIQIDIVQPTDQPPERFKTVLGEQLERIRFYVQSQKKQLEGYNPGLHSKALAAVSARRERIQKHEGLKDILGIPLKRKEGAPATKHVKIVRKLVRPLPPPPKSGYKPEPGITEEDYLHILSVIRHEGRTFETTPKTFAVHDEEELRDILLAHLSGHYQGDAAGEAFRRSGKTDIRIEDNNRAAFVAECKGRKSCPKPLISFLGT